MLKTYKMPRLNNLIVIGMGAPNQLKDGRRSVCVCAWSLDENCFHRVYPVPPKWFRKWDLFDVEVEKNPQDHRENTWKIKNSKEDWNRLHKWIYPHKKKYSQKEELIQQIGFTTLGNLIDNTKSFGIIKPKIKDFQLEQRNIQTTKQMTLRSDMRDLDEGFCIINQTDYKYKPYLVYECEGDCSCKNKIHRQSITEWGCFEFMRKYPSKEINLKDNLRLFDDEWNKYILVGNIHKAPKTYIIIDILRFKKKNKVMPK